MGRGVHELPHQLRLHPVDTDEGRLLFIAGKFADNYKVVDQLETKVAESSKAWEEKCHYPPDIDATARDFFGLRYMRDGPVITISCRKAMDDPAGEAERHWVLARGRGAVRIAAAARLSQPARVRRRARQRDAA